MVERIKLNSGRLQSEARGIIRSKLKKARIRHTPKDIQEDIIREYMQAKNHGNVSTEYGEDKTADYSDFIEDRSNQLTKNIIEQIDDKGYKTWQKALESEVMNHYNNSNMQTVINKLESEINKHLHSVDLSSVLGARAQGTQKVTIKSIKTFGKILKKVVQTVGEKSFWLAKKLTKLGLNMGKVFGTQIAFIAPFFLLFGSLFVGAVRSPMAGLRFVGVMTAVTAAGVGLRVTCDKLGEALGIHLTPV